MSDPFNSLALDRAFRFRAWDSSTGWVDLGLPNSIRFDTWHNLKIMSTGTSFEFYLDGSLLYTDLTGSAAGFEGLQTAFVQAYNYGPSNGNYSVYWDNISARECGGAVPEPSTYGMIGAAALLGLVTLRRRFKK
jgi:hypothetical protein